MKKNMMQKITVFLLIAVICGAIMPELNVTAGEMEADPMATDEMRTDSLAAGEAQTDPMATDELMQKKQRKRLLTQPDSQKGFQTKSF